MFNKEASIFIEGIYFGEGPRWHEGELYFSDFYAHKVYKADNYGNLKEVLEVPNQPSGIGWLPDGSMLVVSMIDRTVLQFKNNVVELYADISEFATFHANDMLVSPAGYCYVGNFGFDLDTFIEEKTMAGLLEPPGPPKAHLVMINQEKQPSIAAPFLDFPNGMVLTPDTKTLIVAESLGMRLTAFDVNADGTLTNKRLWADLSKYLCAPDGICLDANNDVWVANAISKECLLIKQGGELVGKVTAPLNCYACMLGGQDKDTLFIMCAPTSNAKEASAGRNGCVFQARVETPGAGWP
jgi:sugar lactone lactonase YvrE